MVLTPKEPENEVGKKARQHYLETARKVIGEAAMDYTTLYQRFAQNDWAAVKLDEAVALTALKSGASPKEVVAALHQSPYIQYQVHQNKVPLAPMSQYVKSTVQQAVQKIQLVQRRVSSRDVSRTPSHSTQHRSNMELE
jgi:hypothetical protein